MKFYLQENHNNTGWVDVADYDDRNEALAFIRDEDNAYKATNWRNRQDRPSKRVTAAPGMTDEPLDRLGYPMYVGDRVVAAVGSSSTKPSLIVGTIDSFKVNTRYYGSSIRSVRIHIEDAEARGERKFTTLEVTSSRLLKL